MPVNSSFSNGCMHTNLLPATSLLIRKLLIFTLISSMSWKWTYMIPAYSRYEINVDMFFKNYLRSNYYHNYYWKLNYYSLFSVCPMLARVGRCLRDGISPSNTILSKRFFQLRNLKIFLHNLVPSLMWSSPSCSTMNHQPSTFCNPVLSFHTF